MIFKLFNNTYSISFNFYWPKRKDIILDRAHKFLYKHELKGNRNLMYAIVRQMSNKDFVIFSNPKDEQEFIQCTVNDTGIMLDYPYSVVDKRSKLLHRLDYVILKNDLRKKQSIFGNNYLYEMVKHDYGSSIQVNCRQNADLAAKIMHEILTEVYKLDPEFEMEISIDTWKKFWL